MVAALLLLYGTAAGQAPNLSISADLNPQLRVRPDGVTLIQMYDDSGNFSRLRLGLILPNGWRVRVFQKLGRIRNDADKSGLDEAFIERAGDWRVGKQYLPFGSGRLLKESVLGARVNTFLALADLPISVVVVENGPGRQRGVVARVGDTVGISVASGKHFGINATAFTQLRPPEESPGTGRGYRLAYAVDIRRATGGWGAEVEYIRLRNGHTALDPDEDILDVLISYQFPFGPLVEAESTLTLESGGTNLRFSSSIPVSKRVFLVPTVRYFEDRGWVYSLSAFIRL